jgi:carbonic anhydrase/acetyltransferase-like protein (isoleucine patch superfamily)
MSHYHALPFGNRHPSIAPSAFVAAGAILVGDVTLSDRSSIWYGTVVRGDVAPVRIGARTNIQDGTVIHVSRERPEGTVIGDDVTVGHQALIHACTLEDECLIGMKACVMDGAIVERHAWIAAGALVTPGKRVRAGQLWAGTPARYVRDVRPADIDMIREAARLYVENGALHHHWQEPDAPNKAGTLPVTR